MEQIEFLKNISTNLLLWDWDRKLCHICIMRFFLMLPFSLTGFDETKNWIPGFVQKKSALPAPWLGNTGTFPSLKKGLHLIHGQGIYKQDLRYEACL